MWYLYLDESGDFGFDFFPRSHQKILQYDDVYITLKIKRACPVGSLRYGSGQPPEGNTIDNPHRSYRSKLSLYFYFNLCQWFYNDTELAG